MSKSIYVVYIHTNTLSGKSYIGRSVFGIDRRWKYHLNESRNGSQTHFHRAIRKYPDTTWNHTVLFSSFTKESLIDIEIALIKEYNTYENGYNSSYGTGRGVGWKHSLNTKDKMSKTAFLTSNDRSERMLGQSNPASKTNMSEKDRRDEGKDTTPEFQTGYPIKGKTTQHRPPICL